MNPTTNDAAVVLRIHVRVRVRVCKRKRQHHIYTVQQCSTGSVVVNRLRAAPTMATHTRTQKNGEKVRNARTLQRERARKIRETTGAGAGRTFR